MPAGAGGCGRSAAPSGAARAAAGGMPAPREPVMPARGRHACARLGQPAVRVRQGPRTCFSGPLSLPPPRPPPAAIPCTRIAKPVSSSTSAALRSPSARTIDRAASTIGAAARRQAHQPPPFAPRADPAIGMSFDTSSIRRGGREPARAPAVKAESQPPAARPSRPAVPAARAPLPRRRAGAPAGPRLPRPRRPPARTP